MIHDYDSLDGLKANLYLSLNQSADACMLAMKSGMMNRIFATSGHMCFNARDMQAFKKMQEIDGIESAFKKVLIGSASWILEELDGDSGWELEPCDYKEIIAYNMAADYEEFPDPLQEPYDILREKNDSAVS